MKQCVWIVLDSLILTLSSFTDSFNSLSDDVLYFLLQTMSACCDGQYNKDRELANVFRGSNRVAKIVLKGSLTILAGWRQGGAHRCITGWGMTTEFMVCWAVHRAPRET